MCMKTESWTAYNHYIICRVLVRLSIFSQLSIVQYVGLCVFSLPISFVMIDRIYILCLIIIIKSEGWTITHCLGLGHETMVCAVCLSIFLPDKILRWEEGVQVFLDSQMGKPSDTLPPNKLTTRLLGVGGRYSENFLTGMCGSGFRSDTLGQGNFGRKHTLG